MRAKFASVCTIKLIGLPGGFGSGKPQQNRIGAKQLPGWKNQFDSIIRQFINAAVIFQQVKDDNSVSSWAQPLNHIDAGFLKKVGNGGYVVVVFT